MEENKQQRKKYAKKGERSQKMVTFRLDNDLVTRLERQANKGRFINDAIRALLNHKEGGKIKFDEDASPDENLIEEYDK